MASSSDIKSHSETPKNLPSIEKQAGDLMFEVEPNQNLYCPICQELFSKPVTTSSCFHTFCKECLKEAFAKNKSCPLCRARFEPDQSIPNLILASIVNELRVSCRNQCGWTGNYGDLNDHENGSCSRRLVVCIHHTLGCPWKGTTIDLPQHISNCPFELFKSYMQSTQNQIAALKSQIALLNLQIRHSNSSSSAQPALPSESSSSNSSPRGSFETSIESRAEFVSRMQAKYTIQHHTRNVTSLALGENGFFFSASHDTAICMWNSQTCELRHQFTGNKDSIWALAYTDGMLYSGSDGSLKAWSVPTGQHANFEDTGYSFKSGGEGKTYCLIPDTTSSLLFSGNYKTICMWDKNSKDKVNQLDAHFDCVWSLSIQGNLLVSGSDDGTVKVWDLKKLDQPISTLEFADSRFLSVALGGGYIFGGTQSGQIQVWSASTFQHVTSLRGHQWDVWQLAFAGGLLCSGSYDHTIKLWDMESLNCTKTLTGHRGGIYALRAEQLNKRGDIRVYSGSGDKTIKVWEAVQN